MTKEQTHMILQNTSLRRYIPRYIPLTAAAVLAAVFAALPAVGQSAVPATPGSDAPKPPAYIPKGPPPPADDPIPAPTSPAIAQTETPPPPNGTVTAPGSTAPQRWTTDQILTATVHQAWILADRNEENFFQIVRELAEISAQNRGVVLPDTSEAGTKAGQYIRTQARADHNALLYAIVDKAVQMTGKPETSASAASHAGGSAAR